MGVQGRIMKGIFRFNVGEYYINMSLTVIFGDPILNKNLATVISQFLSAIEIVRMDSLSKRCSKVYKNDHIWERLLK